MSGRLTLRLPHWPILSQIGLVLLIIGLGISLSLLPVRIAALVLGSIILFVSGLLHPKIGLYLLIPAIPLSSLFQLQVGGISLGPVEILLGFMLISWLLKVSVQREIIIPTPALVWPFLLFLGVIGLSWLTTISLKASLVETIKWVEMLALYIFIWANFTATESRRLVIILLLVGLLQAGLGLYQFLFKVGPEGFLLFEGNFLRAFGTFQQPNPYGGYLGLILPLALSLTLWSFEQFKGTRARRQFLWWFLLSGSGLGLMAAALFASQSRGAWIGFLGATIVTFLLKGGKWAASLASGLIILAILLSMDALSFLPATISQRFLDSLPFINVSDITTVPVTDANFAILERLAHWQAAQGMWQDHLWLGVGFGGYEVIYPAYAVGRWLDPLGHAHNYILNIGAEMGLVGLTGYLIFWIWVLVFSLRALFRTETTSLNRAVLAGCVGIITHLHLHNLLDNLYVQSMYLHIAVILSLITLIAVKSEGGVTHLSGNSETD